MSTTLFPGVTSASISDCGTYRYGLKRVWDDAKPVVAWIMLNPSTADAEQDDPTIRRCVGFSKAWGYGGLAVVNLFALRATNPKYLWLVDDPVGPENDVFISEITQGRRVVAAWGAAARATSRAERVMMLLAHRKIECLGTTAMGHPRHPLYVQGSTSMRPLFSSLPAGSEVES